MTKYQTIFVDNLKSTLARWTEQENVSNEELFRVIHSVKGTSASIGLDAFSNIAANILEQLHEDEVRLWLEEEWRRLLTELIDLIKEFNKAVEFPESNKANPFTLLTKEVEKLELPVKMHSVLLIDNDLTTLTDLRDRLEQEGFGVIAAFSAERALQMFYDLRPDCVIWDHPFSDSQYVMLNQLLDVTRPSFAPVILTSEASNRETRLRAYDLGATDYFEKPIDPDEMVIRIRNRLKHKELISHLALLDELTGAYNRNYLMMELNRLYGELERYGHPFSVVFMDLDCFKKINDIYGHAVGNQVLRDFSRFIQANISSDDCLIRYGGEEFILLLPKTLEEDSQRLIDQVRSEYAKLLFETVGDTFNLTFSAGISQANNSGESQDDVLIRAEQALRRAKQNGRNCVFLYDPDNMNVIAEHVIHIGVVDDDSLLREMLEDQLYKLNVDGCRMDVRFFREGEEFFASEWFRRPGKFVILLDGMLPRMDGLEVLQRIRNGETARDQEVAVVMLTGRKRVQDIVRALELGADDYITKPFSMGDLTARMKRIVQRMIS